MCSHNAQCHFLVVCDFCYRIEFPSSFFTGPFLLPLISLSLSLHRYLCLFHLFPTSTAYLSERSSPTYSPPLTQAHQAH